MSSSDTLSTALEHPDNTYPPCTRKIPGKGSLKVGQGAVAEVLLSLVRSQIWYSSSQILKSHYKGSELEVPISKHRFLFSTHNF